MFKDFQGHVATVAPAPNGHAAFIHVALASPDLGRRDLIHSFIVADITTDNTPGFSANETCSSTIDSDDNITQIGGDIGLEVNRELAIDRLRSWSTIQEEKNRIFLFGVEVWRAALENLERVTINGYIGVHLRWKGEFFDHLREFNVLLDEV